MKKEHFLNRIALIAMLAVTLMAAPSAVAQNAGCTVDRKIINRAVENDEIRSFVAIKNLIDLQRGDRVLRAALCMRPTGPVYALTIVNDNGVERRVDVNAQTGKIVSTQ